MPDFHFDMYEDLNYDDIIGILWVMFRESAKRQPLDAKILTPNGWTTMGELNIGDEVIGSDGKSTKVKFLSKIVNRPIYELETEDGRKTECDSEHLWNVRRMCNTRKDSLKYKTVDTQYLMDSGLYYDRKPDNRNGKKYKEYKFAIDTVKPVELSEKELSIEPYFLGLWLGDGTSSSVDITNIDKEVEDYLRKYADSLRLKLKVNNHNGDRATTLSITRGYTGGINRFSLQNELRKLGVLNNKHIPKEYLFGSIEQRKALLEGLMDSDGNVSRGTLSFCNKNEKIVDGLVELVRSLGGRASKSKIIASCVYRGKLKECNAFRVSILFTDYTPFRIERKKSKHKLSNHTFSRIVSIKLVGNKLGRCIRISNKDGLYITDDYLLTHNTSIAKIKIIHNIVYNKKKFNIWTSFDQKKAESNLFDIALELQTNKKLISDFGQMFYEEKLETKQSQKKSIGEFITTNRVKVKAYSTGQSPRGEVYGEYRPDFIVLDDIETSKTMVSEAKTKQVIEYIDELLSALGGDANILGLFNRIINNGSLTYFEDKIKGNSKWIARDIPVEKNGKIMWPQKYVLLEEEADLVNKKIEDPKQKKISLQGKRKLLGETVYNREMMNTPLSDKDREIKMAWLQNYYNPLDLKNKTYNRYITIDVADSKEREKRKSKGVPDWTGITCVDWDIENFWYVKYAKRKRLNAPELIDEIFYLWETYHPIKIGVEKKAFEDQIKPYIELKSEETQIYPVVEELEHGGLRKEDRIRGALQGRLQQGKILFKQDSADNTDELRMELYDFPRAKFDDLGDALAYIEQLGHRPLIKGKDTVMPEQNLEFFEERARQRKETRTDVLEGIID